MVELARKQAARSAARRIAISNGSRSIFAASVFLLITACAGKPFVQPSTFDGAILRNRAITVEENGITASASIPSREETLAIFGVDTLSKGIQPVWVEIENRTGRQIYFLRTGLDPEYFSPREAAFALSESMSDDGRQALVEHMDELNFQDPIEPHSIVSGFVLTYEDRGSKFVNIDLLGEGWSTRLSLVVPTPNRELADDRIARLNAMLTRAVSVRTDSEAELRALLERLPCCTTAADGVQGGPLNVVLIGDFETTTSALVRRGFRSTEADPFFAFGRRHDLAVKKVPTWVAAQPHVMRVWLTDIRYRGNLVWAGQISMPLGGRFAADGDAEGPAGIDPDVDSARNDFLQDGLYSQMVAEVGFVKGAGPPSPDGPQVTSGATSGDSAYHTDGLRAVLFYAEEPRSLAEIEFTNWERLKDHPRP